LVEIKQQERDKEAVMNWQNLPCRDAGCGSEYKHLFPKPVYARPHYGFDFVVVCG
jgi:hypothetical protein